MTAVEDLAAEWILLDKDEDTRNEISELLERNDKTQLEASLRRRIAFGTAGLRARMGAGFSRMNSLTVIQTSQGLASYVLDHVPNAKTRGIVIGFDGRHKSEQFAKYAATAFVRKGIKVLWLETMVHTPLVPFTVGELHAAAGVMITASHNPAHDNGYKVYWENGCQIISPQDTGISEAILKNLIPVSWDNVVDEGNLLVEGVLGRVRDAYFNAVRRATTINEDVALKDIKPIQFVYTPIHGVGLSYMESAVADLGMQDGMTVVRSQAKPDPKFPTIEFPNPEYENVLELAQKTADENGITLVLANDPDADRFSVAVKNGKRWEQLTGNQIGILLASHMYETYTPKTKNASNSDSPTPKIAMLTSTVSTRMLAAMAHTERFYCEETLTGFKWLGNVGQNLSKTGKYDVIFAFEEAIGFMFPSVVWDKDGICAAAVFLRACQRWTRQGLTPLTKLQSLYRKYGYFMDEPYTLSGRIAEDTEALFDSIREICAERVAELIQWKQQDVASNKIPIPAFYAEDEIGLHSMIRYRDLTTGVDTKTAPQPPKLPVQRDVQMLTMHFDNFVRFTIRASGTEPKIKLYCEGWSKDDEGSARLHAKQVRSMILVKWIYHREEEPVLV